jgi:hypothetical protein
MGFSYATAVPVRSGVERATLVRRTYGLVFATVIVTVLGAAFAFTQPALMQAVMRHPIIAFLCVFAPLFMVMRAPREFPKNIILTFLFTFIEGIWIAPFLLLAERGSPGVVGQAALLTLTAFAGLSLYAVFSRRDFSAWGGFFMVGVIVLVGDGQLVDLGGWRVHFRRTVGVRHLAHRPFRPVWPGRLRAGGREHLSRPDQHVPVHPEFVGWRQPAELIGRVR